jgi:hypothetical protein
VTFSGWDHLVALRHLRVQLRCPDIDYDSLNPHHNVHAQTFLRFPFVDVLSKIPSSQLQMISIELVGPIEPVLMNLDWSVATAAVEQKWPIRVLDGMQCNTRVDFLLLWRSWDPYCDRNMPKCLRLVEAGMSNLIQRGMARVSARIENAT